MAADLRAPTPAGTVPTGGTTGQVLKKRTNTDLDTDWENETGGSGLPNGGTTGQVLTKRTNANQDVDWETVAGGGGGVTSVNGHTGVVVLGATDVGADVSGAASTVQAASLQKAANLSDVANALTARGNLGVAIGTDVEAHDADLTTIGGLSPANDDVLQRKAGAWTNRSVAQYKTDIGVPGNGIDLTALHAGDAVLGDVRGAFPTIKNAAKRIGSLLIIGHSWSAGTALAATGTPQFERQGMVGRLCGLLSVHETNVKNLAIQGTALGRHVGALGETFGGWAGVLTFDVPYSSRNVSDTTTAVLGNPAVPAPFATVISHGINDVSYYAANTNATNHALVRNGWKHALRAVLSRRRSGALYSSYRDSAAALQWESTIGFGGSGGSHWSDVASIGQNTGPAYKKTTTDADTVTFTIPANFTGGTIKVQFISQGNGWTTLAAAITTTVQTAVTLTSATEFPAAGNYILVVDDLSGGNAEQMLVTAGQGTVNLTVTRGVNGTTAVTHLIGAQVTLLAVGLRIDWSGTASAATGSTALQGQGYGGGPVPVAGRFTGLTAADAGKTIIGTVHGIVTGDTYTECRFDCVGIEAADPPPVVIERIVRYSYGTLTYSPPTPAMYEDINTDTVSVVSEFADNAQYIAIADTDAPFWARAGTLTALMGSATTSCTITANNAAVFATLPNNTTFCIGGERMLAATITNNNDGTFTLSSITRAVDGTTAAIHASGYLVSDATWMHADGVHPNAYGHAVRAEIIYQAFNSLTTLTTYEAALASGATSQEQRTAFLGIVDNFYVQPPVTGVGGFTPVLNTLYLMPFFIPQSCLLIGIACVVTTANTATNARFGIYDLTIDRSRPGALIAELGTVSSVTTGVHEVTPIFHLIEPGWIYLGVVNQGTTSNAWQGTAAGSPVATQIAISAPTASAAALISGYGVTGVSAGLPADVSGSLVEQTRNPIIYPHFRAKHYG